MTTVQEYQTIQIKGLQATQIVRGVERGGYVLSGQFYFPASVNVGILAVPAENYVLADGYEDKDLYSLILNRAREG